MPKLTHGVPKYRLHKQSGQAIATFSGRDFLLGPHGTKASRKKYDRLLEEWLARDRELPATGQNELTVAELAARYWRFARKYYVKNGLPTDEQHCIKAALRPLLANYEVESAAKFGPLALKAVREKMIERGWARQTVNGNVDRIRRMFCWAVENELIPETVYRALKSVKALNKDRTSARECEPIQPVEDALVEATLPHLTDTVADMVRVQRLTGMRPGEVCQLRPCDLDRDGEVWTYRPKSHKTEHHDKSRIVYIGPQAQAVLLRYLARDPAMYCFRPIDSEAKRRAEQHAQRRTPIGYGNRPGTNRKRRPKRAPTDRYDVNSYRRAVERACDSAFPLPQAVARSKGETTGQWRKRLTNTSREIVAAHNKQHRWTPNRLRHTAATEFRQAHGIEAAQVLLGHARADTTEIYAQRDHQLALRVAREVG